MRTFGSVPRTLGAATIVAASAVVVGTTNLFGNHPVYVEGNCFGPGVVQMTITVPGTCGDYDGDGRIGVAEDNDGPDRVFGTINAALGPGLGGTGANQNGSVTIVRDGVFPEVVNITAANGNVTLQAAPGVEAIIDAIVQGVPGGAARQNAPGIIVDAPADRYVVIRNVMSRNWAIGIDVRGNSRAALETVRLENNVNWGLLVQDEARVTVAKSEVHATGFRVGAGTDFPRLNSPMPGVGIEYQDDASGTVFFTTVSGSFRAGIQGNRRVCLSHVNLFDNNPNARGVSRGESDRCDRDRDPD